MIQMNTVAATSSSWRAYAATGRKHDATSADLMVDLYIDPVIERHMNLLSSSSKTESDWKQALRAFQCERMEPRDSKRRTPVAAASSVENNQKRGGDAFFETKKKVSSRQLLSKLERMEWNYSSSNSSHVRRTKAPLRNHGIVAYPKEPEMEQATVAARALSQLLASWSSSHVPQSSNVALHTVPTPQVVEDVERTLLHCRFTSGGSKKNGPTLQPRPVPHPNSRSPPSHPPEKTLMEIDAFSSDSSSMSSLSFPELRQALPPALLRVSTSTILEEQDLIWLQIQQDRAKDEAAPRRRSASRIKKHVVEGEVTRGSHTRPPLSPPGRIHHHASSSFHTPKSRSFRMEQPHCTVPSDDGSEARSKGMMISPPQGGTPDTRTSMASATTGSSSPSSSLAKTLAYTGRHSKDPVGTALCLVCHASLTLFRGSTVVYCSQCGTLATTELLQRRSHNPAEEAAWNAV